MKASSHKADFSDVIVAPASGAGRAAVSVIRLSGRGSRQLVGFLCGAAVPSNFESERHLHLVWLKHPETGRTLDQAMVVFFREGASFTGEESAEIFCHGGPVIVDSVVRACLDLGAKYAGPGDFTRRAVINGRMDLVQAEGVALLTESENETAADVALAALAGSSTSVLRQMSDTLLDQLAECEASLDFDAEDDVYVDLSGLAVALTAAVDQIDAWLDDARAVRPAVCGYRIVLTGLPNAGKSTLFNALAGGDFAIVHDAPGTTRDVISERMVLAGTGCLLFDTAGLRTQAGEVEAEGVRRALKAAADADLVIEVVDGSSWTSTGFGREDTQCSGRDAIVITKSDLMVQQTEIVNDIKQHFTDCADVPVFVVSGATGDGIDSLRSFLASSAAVAMKSSLHVNAVVAGERQTAALAAARSHVSLALDALAEDAPLEVTAAEIRSAVVSLGEITGATITEEVLNRIFSRFCIGK